MFHFGWAMSLFTSYKWTDKIKEPLAVGDKTHLRVLITFQNYIKMYWPKWKIVLIFFNFHFCWIPHTKKNKTKRSAFIDFVCLCKMFFTQCADNSFQHQAIITLWMSWWCHGSCRIVDQIWWNSSKHKGHVHVNTSLNLHICFAIYLRKHLILEDRMCWVTQSFSDWLNWN